MLKWRLDDKLKPEECADEKMHSEGGDTSDSDPEKLLDVEMNKTQDDSEMSPETLQELILKRKAVRKREVEESRQNDLRRIAEMKSRHGIHPVEDLFPEEIWIKIIGDKDLGPMDRYNMRQVHPVFQQFMKDSEIQDILLPLVLDHKIPLLNRLTQLPNSLNMKPILTLRCVSKSVRESADKYITDYLLNFLRNSRRNPRSCFPLTRIDMYPENEENWRRKMSNFSRGATAERAQRLFLRSLEVNFSPPLRLAFQHRLQVRQNYPEVFQNFRAIITELLESVGDQILFLQLNISFVSGIVDIAGVPMPQVVHGLTRELLSLLPNLKWLGLWIAPPYSSAVQDLHMPTLNALEGVVLSQELELSPVLEAVLVANPQVKYIRDLDEMFWYAPYTHPTVLRLGLEDVYNMEFLSLREITDSNWKVKRMRLIVEGVSLEAVFQYLQQRFPTLEQLSLHIAGVVTIGRELNYLRLPNLRSFEITLQTRMDFTGDFHFFFGLQFLLHCDQLESLTWKNSMEDAELLKIGFELLGTKQSATRPIDFQGEGGVVRMDMSRSNIWDVFPQLRCIKMVFPRYRYSIKERRGPLFLHAPSPLGLGGDECRYSQP